MGTPNGLSYLLDETTVAVPRTPTPQPSPTLQTTNAKQVRFITSPPAQPLAQPPEPAPLSRQLFARSESTVVSPRPCTTRSIKPIQINQSSNCVSTQKRCALSAQTTPENRGDCDTSDNAFKPKCTHIDLQSLKTIQQLPPEVKNHTFSLSSKIKAYIDPHVPEKTIKNNNFGLSVFVQFCTAIITADTQKYQGYLGYVKSYQITTNQNFYPQVVLLKKLIFLDDAIPSHLSPGQQNRAAHFVMEFVVNYKKLKKEFVIVVHVGRSESLRDLLRAIY